MYFIQFRDRKPAFPPSWQEGNATIRMNYEKKSAKK